MIDARIVFGAIAAALALSAAPVAQAHHGWGWAETAKFDVTGTVKAARLGNPHGELTLVTANNESWTVEVGQPWRNEQAGLDDAMLAPGAKITINGNRAKDHKRKLIKANSVTISGKDYILYRDRV